MLFKELVHKLRDKLSLTQNELAALLELNQATISVYETGYRNPGRKTIRHFVDTAKKYGIQVEYTDIDINI